MKRRTGAIIVTYYPDVALLSELVARLAPQVDAICIVNNGPPLDDTLEQAASRTHLIQNPENLGVATALNKGIEFLDQTDCLYAVTFDQDSLPEPGLVSQLLRQGEELDRAGLSWAAVGPRIYDARTGAAASIPVLKGGNIVIESEEFEGARAVVHTITSGSLVKLETCARVGTYDDCLFIDYVDIEWCLRAKSLGMDSFVTGNARLDHRLGVEIKRLLGKEIPMHDASRHYYLLRNGVALLKRDYIPASWKRFDRKMLLVRFFAYSLLSPRPLRHFSMMVRGVADGMAGRSGPIRAMKLNRGQ